MLKITGEIKNAQPFVVESARSDAQRPSESC